MNYSGWAKFLGPSVRLIPSFVFIFALLLGNLLALIPLIVVADILCTVFWIVPRIKRLGLERASQSETNPIAKIAWNRFGFKTGTVLAAVITLTFLTVIIALTGFNNEFTLLIWATYIPVFWLHGAAFEDVTIYLDKEWHECECGFLHVKRPKK